MKRLTLGVVLSLVAVGAASAFGATGDRLTVCASGCQYTTLAAAVAAASDGDRIALGEGNYPSLVTIDKDVTIVGAGADATVLSHQWPLFPMTATLVSVAPDTTVAIRDLTIDADLPFSIEPTVGIRNIGTLALKDVVVQNSSSYFEAGIVNGGTMSLKDSVVRSNASEVGGGIWNGGHMTIQDSTVTENIAFFTGGGILNSGTLVVKRSTISNNVGATNGAMNEGGGIVNEGQVSLLKVTFANNTPTDCAGC